MKPERGLPTTRTPAARCPPVTTGVGLRIRNRLELGSIFGVGERIRTRNKERLR